MYQKGQQVRVSRQNTKGRGRSWKEGCTSPTHLFLCTLLAHQGTDPYCFNTYHKQPPLVQATPSMFWAQRVFKGSLCYPVSKNLKAVEAMPYLSKVFKIRSVLDFKSFLIFK